MPLTPGTRLGTYEIVARTVARLNHPNDVPRLRLKDRSWIVNSPPEGEQ